MSTRDNLDNMDRDKIKEMSDEARKELNADPITSEPGSHPVGTGVGSAGGAVAGAAVGSLGGPVGAIVGGVVGAIAGAAAGHAAGEKINPTQEEAYWRENYTTTPYYRADAELYDDLDYDRDYGPAYRLGYENRDRYENDYSFNQAENDLGQEWDKVKGESRLKWEQAKNASRDAWNRVSNRHNEDDYWRSNYVKAPYYAEDLGLFPDLDYDRDYSPAYRLGYENRTGYGENAKFEDAEDDLKLKWENFKGESRLKWEQAKLATRDAWNRITH